MSNNHTEPLNGMPPAVQNIVDGVQAGLDHGLSMKEAIDPERLKEQVRQKLLDDLINGDREPPDETSAMLVARIKEKLATLATADRQGKELIGTLKALQAEAVKAVGAAESYTKDLEEWLSKKPGSDKKPEKEKETNASPQAQ